MNKKGLAILMRTRMRASRDFDKLVVSSITTPLLSISQGNPSSRGVMKYVPEEGNKNPDNLGNTERDFEVVYQSMQSAILTNKVEVLDPVLTDFSEGYFKLSPQNRWRLILALAKEHDLNRTRVQELIKQYLGLELPTGHNFQSTGQLADESTHSAYYRIERNLRHALKPVYEVLFERLNMHAGGLRFLSILRADILSILEEENIASLRALDFNLKEKLTTWLSPAALELHRITWDDSASFLEKIVAYEAVHPISNLIDLKRRLGVGRRCFGYLHPAIPGEPLIFIEVALLKDVARAIQEVLWDDPPIPESEATCAMFYSISATQPGLAGIKLGKFLIKRVINLVQRDMPHVTKFATLSPIPGYMQWLLSKLSSQSNLSEVEDVTHSFGNDSASTFWENILTKDEEKALMESSGFNLPFLSTCYIEGWVQGTHAETQDVIKIFQESREAKKSCTFVQLGEPNLDGILCNTLACKFVTGQTGMEVMLKLLTSTNFEWTSSTELLSVLEPPLMRLCARYLLLEKKRGKALDPVANFHLQNGAMMDRINWMANRSDKGFCESGSIMVNYVYRLEYIEEYGHSYSSTGKIQASQEMLQFVEEHEETKQEKLQ